MLVVDPERRREVEVALLKSGLDIGSVPLSRAPEVLMRLAGLNDADIIEMIGRPEVERRRARLARRSQVAQQAIGPPQIQAPEDAERQKSAADSKRQRRAARNLRQTSRG